MIQRFLSRLSIRVTAPVLLVLPVLLTAGVLIAIKQLGPLVADGRDMGTVVFPDADVKVFLVAELEERARRRVRERDPGGEAEPATVEAMAERLRGRDEQDASRDVAPLRQAADAVLIDTTRLVFEEQVETILDIVRQRLGAG